MREKYESLSVAVLRDLAKSRGIAKVSTMKKAELIEAMKMKRLSRHPKMQKI